MASRQHRKYCSDECAAGGRKIIQKRYYKRKHVIKNPYLQIRVVTFYFHLFRKEEIRKSILINRMIPQNVIACQACIISL